jgi:probable HAF family extracellular repeat protein
MQSPRIGLFLLVFTFFISTNLPAQHYTATSLNAGRHVLVNGVNDSGMSVGGSGISPRMALLWSSTGTSSDLGNLGGHYAEGFGINNLGQVAGYSLMADKKTFHAFLWSPDTGMHDLGSLGGNSMAYAINNNTQIVGEFPGSNIDHAFLWTQTGAMQDIGTLGGTFSRAVGINAAGHVVGTSTLADGTAHAFLWTAQDGMKEIDLGQTSSSQGLAINDSDQVVGAFVNPQDNAFHAFVWSSATGKHDLGILKSGISYAQSINNNGDIVGIAYIFNKSGNLKGNSVIWKQGGTIQKLGPLVVPKIGLPRGATGINTSGQIVANGSGSYLLKPQ